MARIEELLTNIENPVLRAEIEREVAERAGSGLPRSAGTSVMIRR